MSMLRSAYPLLKMDDLCRNCRGTPKRYIGKETCLMCKRNHAAWVKAGYENECNEMNYLHDTWLKAKRFNMSSTGSHNLDSLIVLVFGFPTPQFGTIKAKPPAPKVAAYTPELVYPPIHLNLTGREKKKVEGLV